MTEGTKQEQAIIMNLTDAGCDSELIEQFMTLLKDGRREAGLSLLSKHRCFLLDCYHADQKRIDCLDYLIYTMNQAQQGGSDNLTTERKAAL